ncbi:MAG: flagellar biosynthetic protein FliO [Alphaproteobacteria bacterium]|nr:flagellar biosynthetic protein FliO [Alphaproteobacteria bacterium]
MDLVAYLKFVAALAFVLGLIAALAWVIRRFGPRGMAAQYGKRGRRVAVVEVAPIDARRRLVLVRRDGVEHLLLLGATHDLVVESGVAGGAGAPPAESVR